MNSSSSRLLRLLDGRREVHRSGSRNDLSTESIALRQTLRINVLAGGMAAWKNAEDEGTPGQSVSAIASSGQCRSRPPRRLLGAR
jgi:hypothetical protein